jgi:hypothetical protein
MLSAADEVGIDARRPDAMSAAVCELARPP